MLLLSFSQTNLAVCVPFIKSAAKQLKKILHILQFLPQNHLQIDMTIHNWWNNSEKLISQIFY